jgi:alcohol dehydrogenase class IV
MWFFASPNIIFGENALAYLDQIPMQRVMVISDATLLKLGLVDLITDSLKSRNIPFFIYTEIEPDPSIETVQKGAAVLLNWQPDWIVAVGGGSVIDAAKGMWVLYERPDLEASAINPVETLGLRQKCRMIVVPTTSGTGSEATWAIVLTDTLEKRKLGLGNRENLPDYAILDPAMTSALPPRITADTGLDAMVHAVEGYTSTWHNDFSDGLCLKALELIFDNLPKVYRHGDDEDARIHMQNAATIAGLGFGNSMAALAHGMGHAFGAVFAIPHGRAVALFLPYTIEYSIQGEERNTRYGSLARFLNLTVGGEEEAAASLVQAIRLLERQLDQPSNIRECGIEFDAFMENLEKLSDLALNDTQTIMGTRIPGMEDLRNLFICAYHGKSVDF